VIRERERHLVERSQAAFSQARGELRALERRLPRDQRAAVRLARTRLEALLRLAELGGRLIDSLVVSGSFDARPLMRLVLGDRTAGSGSPGSGRRLPWP